MVTSIESRRVGKPPTEKLIANSLTGKLKQQYSDKKIPWEDFVQFWEITVTDKRFFLNIGEAPPEIQQFLREFVEARMAGKEEFNKFLEHQQQYGDDFFNGRVVPLSANESFLTLSQMNRVLLYLLDSDWQFTFNGEN